MAKRLTALLVCLLPALALWLWLDGWFLTAWHGKVLTLDVNGDGAAERLVLRNRALTLEADGQVLWQTRAGWKTEDFLLGDIDGDGRDELMVLVWRRGSFDKSRPMWDSEPEWSWSQHIFLYRFENGLPVSFWMSSALRPQVKSWWMDDRGGLCILTRQGESTRWAWLTWGLERIDRPPVAL